MTLVPILIVWAHLGFVVTLGRQGHRNDLGRGWRWRHLPGIAAAGPLIWLVAFACVRRRLPPCSARVGSANGA
ncbi:hypothetical protein GCM10027040_13920 [Halomonas shantousis]